jgi:hypothetical protein
MNAVNWKGNKVSVLLVITRSPIEQFVNSNEYVFITT